ncbi:hypothetical protein MRX96_020142 [Rhipicephalus microplus]
MYRIMLLRLKVLMEALDMLSDGAVLSTEAVLNELSCEKKPEATLAIIDSSSHQTHTPETELDSTSRPNMPLKTRLESQMPPLTTPPQTQLVDSLVVLDERRQSDLKPLSFTASYAEAIQKSSEQPTEDLPLQLRDADEMLIGESSLTSQVVVSPPPTLVGNEEASLNVTNTEEPIRATCLLSPAVTESPVQVETEKAVCEDYDDAGGTLPQKLCSHVTGNGNKESRPIIQCL